MPSRRIVASFRSSIPGFFIGGFWGVGRNLPVHPREIHLVA